MNQNVDKQKIYGDSKLKLKYEILNKLGQGCFGTLFRAINRKTMKQIALKIQFHQGHHQKRSNMVNQVNILQRLKGVEGVPKLYGAGRWSSGYYMQLQLLSSSLHEQKNKQFTFPQICVMICELLQILKQIHVRGIIHQDLKPQNIMRNSQGALFVIDFGLSILQFQTNDQWKNKVKGFVGTPRYASITAHNGLPQKPKDDIQSLLYVVGSLLIKKVPWFQLKCPSSKRLQKIQKYKQISAATWLKQCGNAFHQTYQYLLELQPKDQVNYDYIISLFQNARKAISVKTSIYQSVTVPNNRRRSDADHMNTMTVINVNDMMTKQKKKGQKNPYIFKQIEQLSQEYNHNNNNFSQVAQDDGYYMQLLQLLTQSIFFQDNQQTLDSKHVNSILCKQPSINNICQYKAVHFKNPFQA